MRVGTAAACGMLCDIMIYVEVEKRRTGCEDSIFAWRASLSSLMNGTAQCRGEIDHKNVMTHRAH